jgi:hypothetical protein
MLDNPRKTETLMAALKAAVPFEVELTPEVVKQLQAQSLAHADQTRRIVSDLSYAGDEGGIVCHIVWTKRKHSSSRSLMCGCPAPCPLRRRSSIIRNHRVKKLRSRATTKVQRIVRPSLFDHLVRT